MRLRLAIPAALLGLGAVGLLLAQNPFREWPAMEYGNFPLPDSWSTKHEWVRARLRYTDVNGYPGRTLYMNDGSEYPGYWTMDYPRSDRHLLAGVGRLSRIDARPVEQVVTLDGTSDVYHWPTMYAVEPGHMNLTDLESNQLREYLLRGGFLMVDDFHGEQEWSIFQINMARVFPDRRMEDLPEDDEIFRIAYTFPDKFQIPGSYNYFATGLTYEREDGKIPHWRAIRDDNGRVIVAICHNMDMGDAWELSDDERYPEKFASLAYRMGVNYYIYNLTH